MDELTAMQNRRVQRIVAHACATVPYSRDVMDGAGWRLTAAMGTMFGDHVAIAVEQVDALPHEPGGKVRTVISHCRNLVA